MHIPHWYIVPHHIKFPTIDYSEKYARCHRFLDELRARANQVPERAVIRPLRPSHEWPKLNWSRPRP